LANTSFVHKPEWHALKPEVKSVALDNAFDLTFGNDAEYKALAPETQGLARANYKKKMEGIAYDSPTNPQNIKAAQNQRKMDTQSTSANLWDIGVNSFKDMADSMQSADDLTTGEFGDDYGARTAKTIARQRSAGTPAEQKAFALKFATATKEFDVAKGFVDKSLAFARSVPEVVGEVLDNPEGAAYLGAASVSSLGSSLASGWVGAKTGAGIAAVAGQAGPQVATPEEIVTVPLAATIGGITGMFMSNLPHEAQSKFSEIIQEELGVRGLVPNEKNINDLVAESSFRKPALKRARTKAVVTAGVDAVTGAVIGKMGGKLARNAKSISSKVTGKAKVFGAETLSEPISEGAGAYAADGKVELGELWAETVGGFAMSPASAAVDKAVFAGKIAKDTTIGTGKAIKSGLTPKSQELKDAILAGKAHTTHKFEAKTQEAADAGDVNKYPDSPLHTIQILRTINKTEDIDPVKKEENVDKAYTVYSEYKTKMNEVQDRIDVLSAKDPKELSVEERKELRDAPALEKTYNSTFAKMERMINVMTKSEVSVNTTTSDIDLTESVKTNDEATITSDIVKSFGSGSVSGSVSKMAKNAKEIQKTEGLSTKVKGFLTDIIGLSDAKDDFIKQSNATGKDAALVSRDIYMGGKGFKGIETYLKAISSFMAQGNMTAAKGQLAGLKTFQTGQVEKAKRFQHEIANDIMAPNGNPHVPGFVAGVQLEADNLSKAMDLANKMVGTTILAQVNKPAAAQTNSEPVAPTDTSKSKKPVEGVKSTVSEGFKKNIKNAKNIVGLEKLAKNADSKEKADLIHARIKELKDTKETSPDKDVAAPAPDPQNASTQSEPSEDSSTGEVTVPVKQYLDGKELSDPKQVPIEQAMENIDKEIALYEEIRDCVAGK
jgi:hypothetical protein